MRCWLPGGNLRVVLTWEVCREREAQMAPALLAMTAAVSMVGSQSASAVASMTSLVSVAPGGGANANAGGGSVSAGGHFVAFGSAASNIVAGDTNGVSDVFVRDVASGTTERITAPGDSPATPRGAYSPQISSDGRFVLFRSYDPDYNTSSLYLRDRSLQTTTRITNNDELGGSAMSRNGRYVGWGVTRTRERSTCETGSAASSTAAASAMPATTRT